MSDRVFVGFGFGAIQAGLFLYEAFQSRRFGRLVVAEVVPEVVDAVRKGGGRYRVNVATPHGVESHDVSGVEIYNPRVPLDRATLVRAVAEASELATALPSVRFYGGADAADIVSLLAEGLREKAGSTRWPPAVVYTAENHNHAAEILDEALAARIGAVSKRCCQCLNTVIGKMSGVVTDPAQMAEQGLAPMTDGAARAFLVEAFNRILITKIDIPGFRRGISVFEEKADLLPFEEAKLYGHNATHALIGYLLRERGATFMAEASQDAGIMTLARDAFLQESGAALQRRYRGADPLFTREGYAAYVDDLLERMMNPHLRDTVERITRDPRRKLGWEDRLVGTLRLALGEGIRPVRYARGAAAALAMLRAESPAGAGELLGELWKDSAASEADKAAIRALVEEAGSGPV